MISIFVFALLVHTAISQGLPCKDGQEITTHVIYDADYMIGNWTYIYHWDNKNTFNTEFVSNSTNRVLKCPRIEILSADPEFVTEKQNKCGDQKMPFNWTDAKLRLNAPLMKIKDSIIFMGEKENWLMVDCKKMIRVEAKRVSENIMVMINPDVAQISELMSRRPVELEELKCLAHNVDVGKGMSGIGLCQ